MRVLKTLNDLVQFKQQHEHLSLVPTMGNLHAGHKSLIEIAQNRAEHVIVSTYVNPTQFGENEDFDSYPRTFEADRDMCEEMNVSAMFIPSSQLIYPNGVDEAPLIDMPDLMRTLCGENRPTHFQGVATVVLKLFLLIRPDSAVFGEKDFQQLAIIKRLVEEFFLNIQIIGAPIIREPDGLAMSSRNQYLNQEERLLAGEINKKLAILRDNLLSGKPISAALKESKHSLIELGAKVNYLKIVDKRSLAETENLKNSQIVASIKVGYTNLLDNLAR